MLESRDARSNYFAAKGFDLYMIPVASRQSSLEITAKSPLCSTAWLVPTKTKAEEQSLDFAFMNLKVEYGDAPWQIGR